MKTTFKLACLALLATAVPAHAATPLEELELRVKKYATPYIDVYKALCTCAEAGSPDEGALGRLRYAIFASPPTTRRIEVWCQVSRYDVDGDPAATSSCDTFQPLAN